MVTLDPEVNNAQKQQLVADFNKAEIEAIAKEVASQQTKKAINEEKKLYKLRVSFDMECEYNTDVRQIAIEICSYDTKENVIKSINDILSQVSGSTVSVSTLPELQAAFRELNDSAALNVFLFLALAGTSIVTNKAIYEIALRDDVEPAQFGCLFIQGYFSPLYVYYLNSSGVVGNLATKVQGDIASRQLKNKYAWTDAF